MNFEQQTASSLFDAAVESKCTTVSAFLQACMIDIRIQAYVFFNTDEVKFLRNAAWLRKTRAALVRMNAVPVYLSFARKDSCVAGAYFAARKAAVKHLGYSVLENFRTRATSKFVV